MNGRPRREASEDFFDMAAVLDFEQKPGRGNKEALILRRFNVSAARYYQRLGRIIRTPEALKHNPQLVHRLVDQRTARETARAARFPISPNMKEQS